MPEGTMFISLDYSPSLSDKNLVCPKIELLRRFFFKNVPIPKHGYNGERVYSKNNQRLKYLGTETRKTLYQLSSIVVTASCCAAVWVSVALVHSTDHFHSLCYILILLSNFALFAIISAFNFLALCLAVARAVLGPNNGPGISVLAAHHD
ncbi:hypothetical protein ILYODFUR_004267 [Ilyodon furcidens]|uniref:Uncharacterized protein n=1 Tax=Ilyodon furcidens TaxID=33524 RepID=A0ABV0VCJ3_9TELE